MKFAIVLLAAVLTFGCSGALKAQTSSSIVVSACGTPPITYVPGQPYPDTQTIGGQKCTTSGGGSGGSVTFANPATIYSAQQTVTTSAAPLATRTLVNGIVITALLSNTGLICVGPSTVTLVNGYCLGGTTGVYSISYGVSTTANIYIIGANGTDVVQVTGN